MENPWVTGLNLLTYYKHSMLCLCTMCITCKLMWWQRSVSSFLFVFIHFVLFVSLSSKPGLCFNLFSLFLFSSNHFDFLFFFLSFWLNFPDLLSFSHISSLALLPGWRSPVGGLWFWWCSSLWESTWLSQCVSGPSLLHGLGSTSMYYFILSDIIMKLTVMVNPKGVDYCFCGVAEKHL